MAGTGTIIAGWMTEAGVKPGKCSCNSLQKRLDKMGPDWCEEKSEWILGKMKKNIEASGLEFDQEVCAFMLSQAIETCREDSNASG